nr:54s ribosomal protein l36, mitochondrial [Quercus suber]
MIAFHSARPTVCASCSAKQIRNASLLRRPKRPYTFTQLITLSDGSTFLHRTTSPQPVYRSTKDTKNSPMWNPSSLKFHNVEEDEAGRLRRFRKRFGRGFDAEAAEGEEEAQEKNDGSTRQTEEDSDQSLMDLISASGAEAAKTNKIPNTPNFTSKGAKGKGKK